jgi:cysteinyl-tRNA synthetase
VMNITDVGHLTDDGDHGEDKMEKGAKREKKSVWEVARMYEDNFIQYSLALQYVPPRAYTRATEYMNDQIQMIQVLTHK